MFIGCAIKYGFTTLWYIMMALCTFNFSVSPLANWHLNGFMHPACSKQLSTLVALHDMTWDVHQGIRHGANPHGPWPTFKCAKTYSINLIIFGIFNFGMYIHIYTNYIYTIYYIYILYIYILILEHGCFSTQNDSDCPTPQLPRFQGHPQNPWQNCARHLGFYQQLVKS